MPLTATDHDSLAGCTADPDRLDLFCPRCDGRGCTDAALTAALLESVEPRGVRLGGLRLRAVFDYEHADDRAYVLDIGGRDVPRIDGTTEFTATDMAALLASVGVTSARLAVAIAETA